MAMEIICIDNGAVGELVSRRQFQSSDYAEGGSLLSALIGSASIGDIPLPPNVFSFVNGPAVFLGTPGVWTKKKFLVFDLKGSGLFIREGRAEALTILQRVMRFSIKYWGQGVLNPTEKIITGSTKAVLFPLPISSSSGFRITIEREPMGGRLKKRNLSGHFWLVYKAGTTGGDSATEAAELTRFRKVHEALPKVYENAKIEDPESTVVTSKGVVDIDVRASDFGRPQSVFRPYDKWMEVLTERQKGFVFGDDYRPHRLQGPAGTGKTSALLLRTLRVIAEAESKGNRCAAIFVTHSEATRRSIFEILEVMEPHGPQNREPTRHNTSLKVSTLAGICADLLSKSISVTEFVDRDAQDSKVLQEMYIEVAVKRAKREELSSFAPHMSDVFRDFLNSVPDDELATQFQHEISILIKGRSGDLFDIYKTCPSLKYGLPISNEADKGFAYRVFSLYQDQLESAGQFDTDDVVLSATGQLDTPIWRRRREKEGYDFIAVDETHLFNINELHIFHHFSRDPQSYPISFSVDRAQAVGDRGWDDIQAFETLFDATGEVKENVTDINAVFRSSPNIVEVCSSILASGATLFTNFKNTLTSAQSAYTLEDESLSQPVRYLESADDAAMIEGAFTEAQKLKEATNAKNWEVLITSLSFDVVDRIRTLAKNQNKNVTLLERRGDYAAVERAQKAGHIVLGHADYVGGLEFSVVVVVGVDRGRVPYEGATSNSVSRNFSKYTAHNRLYVAASRARNALAFMGVKARGASDLLKPAIKNDLIEVTDQR
ncbi:UvrD-helicase domain-containing protein [Hwanghaeella sp. LZ110]|uniref:UvrD-helicase domain-containing protein n=1 Tax=Hwanghaeella sp. LZ110 TaxID=3402810 RepID=UPI003B677573